MIIPLKEKIEKIKPAMREALGVKNDLALPRLVKVVVSSGTGKAKDKKRNELVADRLGKITGQKAALRGAKKSIATFKLRQGDVIGVAATLRGPRMYKFLDKLFNIAMPRMRDFKGYTETSIDDLGNLTIGIREHVVFPETVDEEIKDVFGMSVTIVTTAKDKKEALTFFKQIGFPFKK
ncbi:MAG: large subunit ribosomal protein [Patescibacteria group bacterium]|nr:large subunit ribosomal protein [Patescibacteria group bacterium]